MLAPAFGGVRGLSFCFVGGIGIKKKYGKGTNMETLDLSVLVVDTMNIFIQVMAYSIPISLLFVVVTRIINIFTRFVYGKTIK